MEFIQHEILETPVTVYNFEVEDYHTYYVSESGVLVHNACKTLKGTANPKVAKAAAKGRAMHTAYKANLHDPGNGLVKEFRKIKGIRPDFVDMNTNTIYELKPNNPNAIKRGYKQLEKYKSTFERKYGGVWNTVLDKY